MIFIGEAAALSASVVWAISISLYGRYSAGQPPYILTLFKNIVAVTLLAGCAILLSADMPKNSNTYWMLVFSGVIGIAIGDTASMAALARVGAQLSALSLCLAPPMAAMIAAYTFGEKMMPRELLAMSMIVLGCGGAILARGRGAVRLEQSPQFYWGIVLITICALANAIGMVLARESMQEAGILSGTLIRALPVVAILLLFHLRQPKEHHEVVRTAKPKDWIILFGIAFLGSFIGLILLSVAAKYAKTGVITTIIATTAVWIIPISRFFLGENISLLGVVSSVVACIGVALMFIDF